MAKSRTGFAGRSKRLTRETPFNYFTQWKLSRAKEFLEEYSLLIAEIANQVGCRSEAAFYRMS